ncbi:hypothetical protein CDL60_21850 [Roseateles noduli]|nr:hypothetical protein CDL60_21850 [Roseateles noduli]
MPIVPEFLASYPPSPAAAFDPHFGFLPGVDPLPDTGGAAEDADGAPGGFAATCAVLADRATTLGARQAAAVFAGLAARSARPDDPLSEDDHQAFLSGEGADLLLALARLAVDVRIPSGLRRDHLDEAAQATDLCATGCAAAWRDAVHRLGCLAGGVVEAAALCRAERVQDALRKVVGATLGRDPAEGVRTLANFESHYVVALERRLGLSTALARFDDSYYDAGTLAPEVLERARSALRQHVTPTAIARSLAEDALEGLRARLDEAGADPSDLWPTTPARQKVIDEEIVAIERRLGPVNRWTLFQEDVAGGRVAVLGHPTWLAVQVVQNLMDAGALPPRAIDTRLAWTAEDGPRRLRQLGDGLWWVQGGCAEGFDPGEARPVGVRQLRDLDRHAAQGASHRLRFSAAEREGLARMPILADAEAALQGIAPDWLVDAELTGVWWRRMGEARCREWLDRHRTERLPSGLRHRLLAAADDAGQPWAFARLLPVKASAAARAWIACDGTGIVAAAVRRDDVVRLRRWQVLLQIAAPALGARQRGQALVARDDQGQSALARAMALPDGTDTLRELLDTMLWMRDARRSADLPTWPSFEEILAGGDEHSLGAVGVALAEGRAGSLQVFLDAVEEAHRCGRVTLPEIRALLLGVDDTSAPEPWRGFGFAMARNHADAVGIWTRALLRMATRRLIDDVELFDALKVGNVDGWGVYHEAMRAGACGAAARYREALRIARGGGLLSREQVGLLLLGHGEEPHALSQAAAAGHVQAVVEHLQDESGLLGLGTLGSFFGGGGLAQARWCRRGGHVAIGAAMRHGQVAVVAALAEHALELQRHRQRPALFPSFAGLPGDAPAIGEAVLTGHLEIAGVWMGALVRGVSKGWIAGRDMLTLMAAKDDRGSPLLHRAVSALDPGDLFTVLRLTVEAVCLARLGSSALSRLLGPGRRHPSLLAAALLADQAPAVRLVGQLLLQLRDEGALAVDDLRQLLALRGRSRWFGRRGARVAPAAGRRCSPATVDAYVSLVDAARRRGWIQEGAARECLRGWADTPGDPVEPPHERALRGAATSGS